MKVNRYTAGNIGKHICYLGIFVGIRFLLWSIQRTLFSWTNLDEIHGDHQKGETAEPRSFNDPAGPAKINPQLAIESLV